MIHAYEYKRYIEMEIVGALDGEAGDRVLVGWDVSMAFRFVTLSTMTFGAGHSIWTGMKQLHFDIEHPFEASWYVGSTSL
jgi:hypothetical protein